MREVLDNMTRKELIEFILSDERRIRQFKLWKYNTNIIAKMRERYVLYTASEAALKCDMSENTLRLRCKQLKIKRIGGRVLLTDEHIKKINKYGLFTTPGKYEI